MHKLIIFTLLTFLSIGQTSLAAPEVGYGALSDEDEFENYETDNVVEIKDPLEKYNRKIFAFNDFVDRYFFEYVALAYRKEIPQPARNSIRNFLTNLTLPLSGINSLLQGKVDNALATFSNFLINSTIGIGGIFNIASEKGIIYRREDFGQTLGHYGVGSGYYLVLPILGPSSTRDFTGFAVDKSVGPLDFNFLEFGGKINLVDYRYRLALAITSGVDQRESLIDIIDDIRKDSFDPYATIRSAYLQKRLTEIKN